jgi:hypothetical protein
MSAITNCVTIAASDHSARYNLMRDPEPRDVAEPARREDAKSMDTIHEDEIDARDPAVVNAVEIAYRVKANA